MRPCCPRCATPLMTSLTSCQCGWTIFKPKAPLEKEFTVTDNQKVAVQLLRDELVRVHTARPYIIGDALHAVENKASKETE